MQDPLCLDSKPTHKVFISDKALISVYIQTLLITGIHTLLSQQIYYVITFIIKNNVYYYVSS